MLRRPVKILILDADDVASACPMKECIDEMSRAFTMQAEGSFQSPLRTRLAASSGDVLVMPSMAKRKKKHEGSVKVVSVFPQNRGPIPSISAVVLLLDGESGEAKAIVEGGTLTAIRTAAVSGLSCRYLARKDSKTLGIIGAGGQAFQQVAGVVAELTGIEKVKIFSRHRARSRSLARECGRALGIEARAEADAEGCVRRSDVIVTATTSKTPVFHGDAVAEGSHVIAIGAYRPDAREVDSSLASRASIFVDSREAALEEAGDILIPLSEGKLPRDPIRARALGARPRQEEGEDLAVGGHALQERGAGVGRQRGWMAGVSPGAERRPGDMVADIAQAQGSGDSGSRRSVALLASTRRIRVVLPFPVIASPARPSSPS